jgi:hypothetical protein
VVTIRLRLVSATLKMARRLASVCVRRGSVPGFTGTREKAGVFENVVARANGGSFGDGVTSRRRVRDGVV